MTHRIENVAVEYEEGAGRLSIVFGDGRRAELQLTHISQRQVYPEFMERAKRVQGVSNGQSS